MDKKVINTRSVSRGQPGDNLRLIVSNILWYMWIRLFGATQQGLGAPKHHSDFCGSDQPCWPAESRLLRRPPRRRLDSSLSRRSGVRCTGGSDPVDGTARGRCDSEVCDVIAEHPSPCLEGVAIHSITNSALGCMHLVATTYSPFHGVPRVPETRRRKDAKGRG